MVANTYRVTVTEEGAYRARKLDNRLGQMDLFFRDNKDGIFGLLIVIAVSVITSLITTLITRCVAHD